MDAATGCDEWIAAEGGFDIGSAQRLRVFLSQFSGHIPPIYFQSPGGIQEEAIAIGRLMREHGVTAGVGRTLPYGCAPAKEGEDRCLAIKRSGLPLTAELRSTGSSCSSACVYALLGAQVRLVPPDARLGVHASRRVRVYPDGRVTRLPGDDQTQLAEATNELKRYVAGDGDRRRPHRHGVQDQVLRCVFPHPQRDRAVRHRYAHVPGNPLDRSRCGVAAPVGVQARG